MGPLALIEAAVFILVLAVGLAYVWKKGDVDWIPMHGHDKPGARLGNEDLTGGLAAAATPPTPEPVGAGAKG